MHNGGAAAAAAAALVAGGDPYKDGPFPKGKKCFILKSSHTLGIFGSSKSHFFHLRQKLVERICD